MSASRKALQADIDAFLRAGGRIQPCDSQDNAGATAPPRMGRKAYLAYRKRLDGNAMTVARARRQGGGQ